MNYTYALFFSGSYGSYGYSSWFIDIGQMVMIGEYFVDADPNGLITLVCLCIDGISDESGTYDQGH